MVQRLTLRLGLIRRQRHGSREGLDRHEYRPTQLAHRLGISRDLVRRWLRVGWLNVRRDEDGHHIIWADADELRRLRALHRLPRTWANKARLAVGRAILPPLLHLGGHYGWNIENRNKEIKCDLAMDRLSDHRFVANFFRLYLHVAAMNLLVRLRRFVAEPLPALAPPAETAAPAVSQAGESAPL